MMRLTREEEDDLRGGYADMLSEVKELIKENQLLRDALSVVEWVGCSYCGGYCPWCDGDRSEGHKEDCQRQEIMVCNT